ncbi:MAG TPA: hypothetical protein VGN57_12160 [Pirellulaceae bacterium]|jgi:hypothetical protein|nr:hypothetical protein [Pirellulaceae bacterium]
MTKTAFDKDGLARWYASQHLKVDEAIPSIFYLPAGSGEREIRLVEVNERIGDRTDDYLEPIDFGIDMGMESAHKLFVLDVTPDQWNRIDSGRLSLPKDWSLEGMVPFRR